MKTSSIHETTFPARHPILNVQVGMTSDHVVAACFQFNTYVSCRRCCIYILPPRPWIQPWHNWLRLKPFSSALSTCDRINMLNLRAGLYDLHLIENQHGSLLTLRTHFWVVNPTTWQNHKSIHQKLNPLWFLAHNSNHCLFDRFVQFLPAWNRTFKRNYKQFSQWLSPTYIHTYVSCLFAFGGVATTVENSYLKYLLYVVWRGVFSEHVSRFFAFRFDPFFERTGTYHLNCRRCGQVLSVPFQTNSKYIMCFWVTLLSWLRSTCAWIILPPIFGSQTDFSLSKVYPQNVRNSFS